jgi:hypothetical protein
MIVAGDEVARSGRGDISTLLQETSKKTAQNQHENEDDSLRAASTVMGPEKYVETRYCGRATSG